MTVLITIHAEENLKELIPLCYQWPTNNQAIHHLTQLYIFVYHKQAMFYIFTYTFYEGAGGLTHVACL